MAGKLLGGHENIGGGAFDINKLAPNLLQGGGHALMSRDAQVGDITDLGLQVDAEEDEPEEDDNTAEDGEPKPEKWWTKEQKHQRGDQTARRCDDEGSQGVHRNSCRDGQSRESIPPS